LSCVIMVDSVKQLTFVIIWQSFQRSQRLTMALQRARLRAKNYPEKDKNNYYFPFSSCPIFLKTSFPTIFSQNKNLHQNVTFVFRLFPLLIKFSFTTSDILCSISWEKFTCRRYLEKFYSSLPLT